LTVLGLSDCEYPSAKDVVKQVHKLPNDIVFSVGCTPPSVGESTEWKRMKKGDELNGIPMWTGRNPYSALSGMYTVILSALKETL
jgi:hypothetical protein